MPTFTYKGHEFDVDHTPIAEEFQQMSAYVDSLPPKEQSRGIVDKALGALDTAAGMVAGAPAQIAGGLGGLSTLLSGQGLEKAADTSKKIQESNFGFGAYKPATEAGKEYTEGVGSFLEKPIKVAGELGFKVGGELGRTNAEIATESLMNLVDPTIGLGAIAKGIRGRKMPEKFGTKAAEPLADLIQESKATEKLKSDFLKSEKGTQGDLFGLDNTEGMASQIETNKAVEPISPKKQRRQMGFDFGDNAPKSIEVDKTGEAVRSDANPNDLYARDAAAKKVIDELDAEVKRQEPIKNLTGLEDEMGQQSLFDHDTSGRMRNPYEAELGDWRIDENGMPVKVDKSMEANNLEQPLQRSLWGDELGPAQGQDRSLTQAIDSIPDTPFKGDAREQALSRLNGGAMEPTNGLLVAIQEANGPKLPFDPTAAFEPRNPLPTERLGNAPTEPPKGLPEPPVAPITPRPTPEAPKVPTMESQTGSTAKLEPLPPAERPIQADTVARPISPKTIEEKRVKAQAVERMPFKDPKLLDEFTSINTKEEAKARLEESGYKDISKDYGQKALTSGVNTTAALTNSPILKFARTVLRDARVAAEKFSREYITSKDGISPSWSRMTEEQRVKTMEVLMEGDKHQTKITPEIMDSLGLSDNQRKFIDSYYKADDVLYNRYNGNLMAAGFKPLTYREGHFPGIFKGAYKSLVTDSKGSVIGVIAVDSTRQLAKAKEWFNKNHPDVTIVDQARKGLADYKQQSDIFSGMNDIMQMLAEKDPRFAEVQTMVSEAIKHGNNSLFAFNRHELSKKGVIGNEGAKPWLDAKENANASYKALVQYLEEGALHHELQQPLKDIRDLSIDPAMQAVPNTMKYLDSYVKHVTGQNVSPIGRGIDAVLDFGPKLVGVGPRVPLQIAGTIKNKMSQKFMGFGNWAFTAAQLTQPMQTGLPFLQLAAGRLGLKAGLDTPRAMMHGGTQFLMAGLEQMTGKHMDIVQPHMREAYQYAQDRGMVNFSEMERAYEGNKTAFGRGFDKAAEINMKIGEVGTRAPMFMTFVDMLHKNGIAMKDALPISENLTQLSMIDYHQWERPQVYAKLGTIGQFAGGLTTFKHGFVGQQAILAKNAMGLNPVGKAQIAPVAMSFAAMVALAGITGAPFYDELDNVYGYLTNKFADKRLTIKESVLKNLPEWANSGAIAAATNVGIGSKFSSANMVPDTLAKAASPQLEALTQIVANAIDLAKNGDAQAGRNLLQSVVPASIGGVTESAVARDKENYVIGKDGKRVIQRSPEDWRLREITGMRPQSEVVAREETYKNKLKMQADQEKVKQNSQEFARREINGTLTPEKIKELELDNFKRNATPGELINRIGQASIEKQKTEKQRLEGVPSNYSGMKKFQNFNPPAVNKPGER